MLVPNFNVYLSLLDTNLRYICDEDDTKCTEQEVEVGHQGVVLQVVN